VDMIFLVKLQYFLQNKLFLELTGAYLIGMLSNVILGKGSSRNAVSSLYDW